MCDVASLTLVELQERLRAGIARRLDAVTDDDRAHAGEHLLHVLDELARRGVRPARPASSRTDVGAVPTAPPGVRARAPLHLQASGAGGGYPVGRG